MSLYAGKAGRQWCLGITCLLGALFLATPAFAQFDRGQISGVVKDDTGGVVPGATVTATQVQTQTPRTTVTDASGFYTFANLPSGRYDLAAELQGFKKAIKEGVQLDAAGSLTMDFGLSTGAISENVTVTAEQTLLQTDVALRKTVESKDIEQLSFSGRNPIGVAGLKAGVIGGSFNNYGFSDLGNGGFNINGSRSDENNITVDGATAIRTRSSGNIVGIQNVDAIQEVQVLTGDYMPEYGRASGGQIRMVTKSGSNRFSGSASYYLRDDTLQANTWGRNRSVNAFENSGPAPFDFKQYAYSLGGPVPVGGLKDKLFFFGAQEWVNYKAILTNVATVPTAKMRTGDFSELLDPNNGYFAGARVIIDPNTGIGFPGNIIPTGRLSPNGLAMLNAYPLPTPNFRQGTNNAIISSDNPQDQRKDNIRLDYRLNDKNQFTYRYGQYSFKAVDPFGGTFPYARPDWNRPNRTQTASWTNTLSSKLINEFSFTNALDEVFIGIFQGTDLFQRSKYGINYPYIFPENKLIPDKIPTISIDTFTELNGAALSGLVARPHLHVQQRDNLSEGAPHDQGGHLRRILRPGRLRPNQRPAHPGQHEQPERPLPVHQCRRRRQQHRDRHRQRRARPVHQLCGDRRAGVHQVPVARHRPVRAGLVAAGQQPDD